MIQPACGMKFCVQKGQIIHVIDVEGGQVADFFAEMKESPEDFFYQTKRRGAPELPG